MFSEYLIPAGATLIIATGGWGLWQRAQVATLKSEVQAVETSLASSQGALATCGARLTNLQEAAASNAAIPDDLRDFDIPSHWLQPDAGTDPTGD